MAGRTTGSGVPDRIKSASVGSLLIPGGASYSGWCKRCIFGAHHSILQIENVTLAVDHFPVLRDRDVKARARLRIRHLDGLGHGVWILAAVFHRFEAKAGPIHLRILRPFLRCELGEPMGELHAVSHLSL